MKLSVFGATGGVGREVVTQALDAGHEVRAYVRNPAKLDLAHPNLVFRQPVPQVRRQQQRLLSVTSEEVLRHEPSFSLQTDRKSGPFAPLHERQP